MKMHVPLNEVEVHTVQFTASYSCRGHPKPLYLYWVGLPMEGSFLLILCKGRVSTSILQAILP